MDKTKRDPFVTLVFLVAELMLEQHAGNPQETELREAIDAAALLLSAEENAEEATRPTPDTSAIGNPAGADSDTMRPGEIEPSPAPAQPQPPAGET